ncbi:hypothetical protein [Fibrella forsythiae]|uniref:DUF308 domain-containing protein n=1 Tax=Fibrella forsythiae TaxID=2817061 RepID=A0ABS3JD98_9BACT|nr:hypothetical protein [Fibrella forsythiae]MBO0947979.1 hypothetical protein [Fibrella forsythiae]
MATTTASSTILPWPSLYLRAGFLGVLGILLFLTGSRQTLLSVGGLSALLLLAGFSAHRFWRSSRSIGKPDYWFMIAGILDIAFGIGLLFYLGSPTKGVDNLLGSWGVLVAITQAVATIYTFLGVKDNSESGQDMTVIILHFINALLGGGTAFMLVQRPFDDQSMQVAGLFPVDMAVLLVILVRRLKMDVALDESQQSNS